MTRLLFWQNDSPMWGSFWQKENLITRIFFELQSIIILNPVANFGYQSLVLWADFLKSDQIGFSGLLAKNVLF